MPGRIMENGSINGSHTNHERDKRLNGVNGLPHGPVEKGKIRSEPEAAKGNSIGRMTPNGSSDDFSRSATTGQMSGIEEVPREMISQLPPELLHISAGYIPLSKLLTRVTEHTHNVMESTVMELARMPLPSSALNGNATHSSNGGDDNSPENIGKKKKLLDFAQDTHTKFTKTLMLTNWSRKSEDVSKVIDLRVHLLNQTTHFDNALEKIALLKRDLGYMRVRNPDLKTAVEVLSTGKCSWMPELNYIDPPPLTAKEILKILGNLNTLLSIRLNLHDYEKVPFHFKNFSIKSGRVTFHVAGEFELDLTIADENPETQFWFIDFRFLFTPRISRIPEVLLSHIENRVNFILAQDDPLGGCYKFLHELVLTHKIAEIKKQAYDLNRGKWVGTLVIEPLQRALCIQYWHGRYGLNKGPKSWVIIGVNSGKRKDGKFDAKATPCIGLRWFRDAKEVKDINIPLDLDRISTEALLKTVIAMHVEHILTSTHEKLKEVPLYKDRDLALELSISRTEPIQSTIKLQATHNETLTVAIEPVSGKITLSPASFLTIHAEGVINNKIVDPVKELSEDLMNFRPSLVAQELKRKCVSAGWENVSNPGLLMDDMRTVFRKDTQQVHWLKRPGWRSHWYVAVGVSTSGEEWKLVETSGAKRPPPAPSRGKHARDISTTKIARASPMPLTAVSPTPSYAFFGTLHIYAASQISQLIDVSAMHAAGIKHVVQYDNASVNATSLKVPKILIHLQGLAKLSNEESATPNHQDEHENSRWAKDMVSFSFSGIESKAIPNAADAHFNTALQPSATGVTPAAGTPTLNLGPQPESTCIVINQASVIVPSCKNLELLGEHVDNDIGFHAPTGTFTIRISTPIGQSSILALQKRLRDVERLVQFVKVMDNQKSRYTCESVSLNKIVFTYRPDDFVANEKGLVVKSEGSVSGGKAVTYRASVNVECSPNAKMTLGFEKGNPHIRMEESFNQRLRQCGLDTMFDSMTSTLALLTAFDAIEKSSSDLGDTVTVSVNIRELLVSRLVYRFFNPTRHPLAQAQKPKFVRLEISYRKRGITHHWMVKRVRDAGDDQSPDEIDALLKQIWCKLGNNANQPWKGLNTSASAEVTAIGCLLLTIDKVLKSYVNQKEEFEGDKGKERESKGVAKEEKVMQGPASRPVAGQAQQQQQQRGVAPQAPMMVPAGGMNMTFQQQMALMPPAQQRQALARYRQAAARRQNQGQGQSQGQGQGQVQGRQGQNREVITLDD